MKTWNIYIFKPLYLRRLQQIPIKIKQIIVIVFIVYIVGKISALQEIKQKINSIHQSTDFKTYNLLEESPRDTSKDDCNIDYINSGRIEQDHPCIIDTIRRQYLYPPADDDVPYFLDDPEEDEPSAGQVDDVLNYFDDQRGGFFIECGAGDGELLSNSLYMERFRKWSGLLIEAGRTSFGKLFSRRRKSYSLPVCLSLEPYPTEVHFKDFKLLGAIQEAAKNEENNGTVGEISKTQCFPLYSILLAVKRTSIDYFSLDVEGHELRVLRTIPWHKVDIKVVTVEWDHVGILPLIDFFILKSYTLFGFIRNKFGNDLYFSKNGNTFPSVPAGGIP